jgi:glycine/D-amino acid oxidase-like deaminating enzyme
MMRTRSFWTARLPESRQMRYPVHRGHVDLDVAIVGGGLPGCAAAFVFALSNIRAGLFEADRLAREASGSAPGVILPEPAVPLTTLQATLGRRGARMVWEATRLSALDFAALLRRLGIRCDLAAAETLDYLSAHEHGRALERERDLRADLGVDAQWLAGRRAAAKLRAATSGAIRTKGAFVCDPYAAALGLARAAVARGAQVFERSPVTKIRATKAGVEIATARGTVSAARVIVATGEPTRLFQPLARRFTRLISYRVLTPPLPAAIRRLLPATSVILREAACPGHLLRWTRDNRVLFAGIDGQRIPERSRPGALVQHCAQLMYELSLLYPDVSGIQPEFGWDALTCASDDGLPYIGPHRHYPHHLFALGGGRSDAGAAYLAAKMLLRSYTDTAEKSDAFFGFGR